MTLQSVPQLGFDEQVIEDNEVEAALEERQDAKDRLSTVRKQFDEKHAKALAEIQKLELPAGGAARVGQFRVTRTEVPGRTVASFETKARTQLSIEFLEDAD